MSHFCSHAPNFMSHFIHLPNTYVIHISMSYMHGQTWYPTPKHDNSETWYLWCLHGYSTILQCYTVTHKHGIGNIILLNATVATTPELGIVPSWRLLWPRQTFVLLSALQSCGAIVVVIKRNADELLIPRLPITWTRWTTYVALPTGPKCWQLIVGEMPAQHLLSSEQEALWFAVNS